METKRHAALGFIFVTVLLDMLAFGIIAPVLPRLISDFLHGDMARASKYMGLFVTTWALMQFFFSPNSRHALRPLRKAASHPAVELRPRPGLHRDGALAHPWVALPGPRSIGHHLIEYRDRERLHQRRHAAGKARPRLWHFWRGVRHRVHTRAGYRRLAWRRQSAPAVLGGRGLQPAQRSLRAAGSAGVSSGGPPPGAAQLEEREPSRRPDTAALAPGTVRARRGELSRLPRA